jgi:small-conductance mechanosensitive channel
MLDRILKTLATDPATNKLDLLLVMLGATLLAYLLILPLRRKLTGLLSPEPLPGERVSWFAKTTANGMTWPLAAAILAAIALMFLPGSAPWQERIQVLSALWFLAMYQVISATLQAFFQPGPFRRRARRGIMPTVIILALFDHLSLLRPAMVWLDQPLITIQNTEISILSVAASLLIAIVFVLAAKAVGDLLTNRILPRIGVETALADALGAISRYLIVLAGFFYATSHLGFDLTSLKIVLGALSVGIGFGLQTIFNNFVSGLILMFERAVKRGDIIEVGNVTGRVLAIGLRSSVIRTRAGHEIIVPNSAFVSGQVDNLSYRDTQVRVDVQLGVSYSADPEQVRQILIEVAMKNPTMMNVPAPTVLFTGYGASSLDFELRGWTMDIWNLPALKSELLFSAWYALKDAGIEIPFPQMDLHLRSGELPIRYRQASD